jgi:hypothetical protein
MWQGWHGERECGDLQEQEHVVVAGCAVQPQPAAVGAAVDEHPTSFPADRDGDRLHAAVAARLPVAGSVAVKVPRPQAAGTVVAM